MKRMLALLRPACALVPALALPGLLVLSGCGGERRASAPVPAEVEAPVASGESGIPGLSVAEVEMMPPVPELPKALGPQSDAPAIASAAEAEAAREERRKSIGQVSRDKRALYLTHVWRQKVHQLRRAQPSEIEGLTLGEVEDQPPAPELASFYDLQHSAADLHAQAWITAHEERAQGLLKDLALDKRAAYLQWYWQKPLAERQAISRRALEKRQARAEAEAASAAQTAHWRAELDARKRENDKAVEAERRKFNPVLSPEQQLYLQRLIDDAS